jgi:hypothetical protein
MDIPGASAQPSTQQAVLDDIVDIRAELSNQSAQPAPGVNEMPQSKLWTHDRKWWSVFPRAVSTNPDVVQLQIYRLDLSISSNGGWVPSGSPQSLTNFTVSKNTKADVLDVPSTAGMPHYTYILLYQENFLEQPLYVANPPNPPEPPEAAKLIRIEYNDAADSWVTPFTELASLSGANLEHSTNASIAMDSNDRSWLATTQLRPADLRISDVVVWCSDPPSYASFTRVQIPGETVPGMPSSYGTLNNSNASGAPFDNPIEDQDLAAIEALALPSGSAIGVMWSDQENPSGQQEQEAFRFRLHLDSAAPNNWQNTEDAKNSTPAPPGSNIHYVDNHINLAASSNGMLYAAVKAGDNEAAPSAPTLYLLVRRPDSGSCPSAPASHWDCPSNDYAVTTAATDGTNTGTRPIVVLGDLPGNDNLFYFYANTSAATENATTMRISHLAGGGTPGPWTAATQILANTTNERSRNLTSTRQIVKEDLVVLAYAGGPAPPTDARDNRLLVAANGVRISNLDGDSIPNAIDNCLWVSNESQADEDVDTNANPVPDGCGNRCDGDFNESGGATIVDFNIFESCYGRNVGPGGPPDDPNCEESDMNDSGSVTIVDFNDFNDFKAEFGGDGTFQPGPSATPTLPVCQP